ncbi:MAG: hypothetical protein GW939_00045 [Candidatus Magasanikbacteria bacterium]|nr:hypothetical protein [Candidatus Magasanikbacteria bacterium]NCS71827.1 hypothetical protein [Candidatus Magasanikbacteria bacterium]
MEGSRSLGEQFRRFVGRPESGDAIESHDVKKIKEREADLIIQIDEAEKTLEVYGLKLSLQGIQDNFDYTDVKHGEQLSAKDENGELVGIGFFPQEEQGLPWSVAMTSNETERSFQKKFTTFDDLTSYLTNNPEEQTVDPDLRKKLGIDASATEEQMAA